jgi:hypothetical protein
MIYKGVKLKDALSNLTARIKDDLMKEGLTDVYYRAEEVIAATGSPAIAQTITTPDAISPEQLAKVNRVIGKHVEEFLKERYGHQSRT